MNLTELYEHFNSVLARDESWADEEAAYLMINGSLYFGEADKPAYVAYLSRLVSIARSVDAEDRLHLMRLRLNRSTAELKRLTGFQLDEIDFAADVNANLNACLLRFDKHKSVAGIDANYECRLAAPN